MCELLFLSLLLPHNHHHHAPLPWCPQNRKTFANACLHCCCQPNTRTRKRIFATSYTAIASGNRVGVQEGFFVGKGAVHEGAVHTNASCLPPPVHPACPHSLVTRQELNAGMHCTAATCDPACLRSPTAIPRCPGLTNAAAQRRRPARSKAPPPGTQQTGRTGRA